MTDGERRDPISLSKNEPEEPLDFDPYRFGAPDHPIPPEYAPPGYRAPQPAAYPPPEQPSYWAPTPPPYSQYPQPRTGNGMAIAALVLGIVSIGLSWFVLFDLIPVVLALVFGILARNQSVRHPERGGRGMAVAAIACAVVGGLLTTMFTVWALHRFGSCGDGNPTSAQVRTCIQQRF